MSNIKEIWKCLPGNSRYDISNYGRIWDYIHLKPVIPYINKGYPTVSILYNENKRELPIGVHRLVIWAFTGFLSTTDLQVNHKDGNKLNSHISNLEVITNAENNQHAFRIGLHKESQNKRRETIRLSKLR